MGSKQSGGDYEVTKQGIFVQASPLDDMIEQVNTCLKVKKGSFACNRDFGSELYTLDIANCTEDTLKVYVTEALAQVNGVRVLDVKRNLNTQFDSLALTISLLVEENIIIMEV